ncbi:MAG: hypothetical protein ACFFG0_06330 [Candidatus Thorarchaeota archaeon]
MDYNVIKYISMIENEYYRANKIFPFFNSSHEGYGVIAEEFKELEKAIFKNYNNDRLIEEAVQLGAMALKFLVSCCNNNKKEKGD